MTDSSQTPTSRCALGFSCASMMLSPNLKAADCPNYETCRGATGLPPDEPFSFQLADETGNLVTLDLDRQGAAISMLRRRGCPQSPQSLGLLDAIAAIETQLSQLRDRMSEDGERYIAPLGAEVHAYSVKRPQTVQLPDGSVTLGRVVYGYHKLTARTAIFEPSEREQKVRVIHLSHDDDPRHLEALAGVKRRNQLLTARTRLELANNLLAEALNVLADEEVTDS